MIPYINTFKVSADFLEGWEDKSKCEIFQIYRKANNDFDKESAFSALVCKYWYMTTFFYKRGKNYGISYEDCIGIVTDGIWKAINLEAWNEEDNKIHKYDNAPEVAINQCMKTIFLNMIRTISRREKRIITVSYDDIDLLSDDEVDEDKGKSDRLIEKYLDNREYFKALVVDGICYQPIDVVDKEVKISRLISYIKHIDVEETCRYFLESYDIKDVKSFRESVKNISDIKERNVRNSVIDVLESIKIDYSIL